MTSVVIDAGELDQEIEIQIDQGETKTAAGQPVENWQPFFTGKTTRWAGVRQLRGWEVQRAAQQQIYATHLITLRYFPGCTPLKMRAVHGSRIYDFQFVDDVENAHVRLEVTAAERIA